MTHDENRKVIFTTGTSFSGSTILSLLLDSHPEVVALGDGLNPQILQRRVDTYLCSCGQRILSCPFWTGIAADMRVDDATFSLADCNMRFSALKPWWDSLLGRYYEDPVRRVVRQSAERIFPAHRRLVSHHRRRNIAFCRAVLDRSGKTVYVHNTKPLLMLHYLWGNEELNPYVLHIVRDPRGFVASAVKRGMTVGSAAERWVRYHQSVLHILRDADADRVLMIPYEDICNDTDALLARVFDFFGVEKRPISRTIVPTRHHILGNDLRLEERFDLEMDLSWRDRLSTSDAAEVRNICAKTYKSLGFDWH